MKKQVLALMFLMATVAVSQAQQTKNDKMHKQHASSKTSKKKVKSSDVPKEVQESFVIVYPAQTATDWYAYPYYWDDLPVDTSVEIDYLYPEYYEVDIMKEGKKHHGLFSRSGKYIQDRMSIKKEDLPKNVQEAFAKSPYKDWPIVEEEEKIHFNEPKDDVYKIVVKKGMEKHSLYYREKNGELVQEKKIKM